MVRSLAPLCIRSEIWCHCRFCSFVLKASNLSHLDMAAAQQMQQQQQQQPPQMDTSGHSQVPSGGVSQAPTSAVTSQTSYLASCSHSASYLTDEASLSNRERSVVSQGPQVDGLCLDLFLLLLFLIHRFVSRCHVICRHSVIFCLSDDAYPCLVPSRKGSEFVLCTTCKSDFIVQHGGRFDRKRHVESKFDKATRKFFQIESVSFSPSPSPPFSLSLVLMQQTGIALVNISSASL